MKQKVKLSHILLVVLLVAVLSFSFVTVAKYVIEVDAGSFQIDILPAARTLNVSTYLYNEIKDEIPAGKTFTRLVFDYWDEISYRDETVDITINSTSNHANEHESVYLYVVDNPDDSNTVSVYFLSKYTIRTAVQAGSLFSNMSTVESIILKNLDMGATEEVPQLFQGCSSLKYVDVSGVDTGNIKKMASMFAECEALEEINLGQFDTSSVTTMEKMFKGCSKLTEIDLSGLNTENVSNMAEMFTGCRNLSEVNLSGIDTHNVKNMSHMFSDCTNLTTVNLENIDTSMLEDASYMFYKCSSLKTLDLSSFDTKSAKDLSYMFYGCSGFQTLDLSSFDVHNVQTLQQMFDGCSNLTTIYVSDKWQLVPNDNDNAVFWRCQNLVGGNNTQCISNDKAYTSAKYARIDKEGQPGYFTDIKATVTPAVALDTSGMQNLSAEPMDLGSTFAESGEQSYGILLTPDEGFLLPETFTITIGERSCTVSTTPDGQNPEGFAWFPEENLLVISGDLLSTGGTIFITAEAVPEAEPTVVLDLSEVSNVTVSAGGTPITGALPLTGEALALTLQANDGYALPASFTLTIGEITYAVTTADGTVTDGNSPITDIAYADSVLTIAPTLLHEDMSIAMNITGEKVTTDPDGEETPTKGTDIPTEGEETPTEGSDTPTEGEETPTEGTDTPIEGEETPTEGTDTPIEGEETPTEGTDTPTEGEETPSEGNDAPTEGEETPAGVSDTPTEGEETPTEGEEPPTDGEEPAAA